MSVHVDSFLVQLGVFHFQKFFADSASKVTKAASKAKVSFKWDKGETTISAKGIAKNQWLHPEIEDEEGWAKVEGMVKRWMKSPKAGDINVNMILTFKRIQPGTDDVEFEDEEHVTGKKSTTAKMLQDLRQQKLIDVTHNESIYTQYKCMVPSCPNKRIEGWCVVIDTIHLKLLPIQITTWSIAINEDRADIDNAPPELLKSLMPAKSGQVNPLRQATISVPSSTVTKTTTPSKPVTLVPSPFLPPPSAPSYPPYSYHAPPSPYPYYNPYAMPNHYPFVPSVPPPPLQYEQHVRQALTQTRSSSIGPEVDTVEQLKDYIAWMSRRSPTYAVALAAAQIALLEKYHTIDTIENVTDEQFRVMQIEDGLAAQFRTLLSKFRRRTLNHR